MSAPRHIRHLPSPLLAFLTILLAATLTAPPLAADSLSWATLPANTVTGTVGAAVCPHEDPERGSHTCLSFECAPGEPLTLAVSLAGVDDAPAITLALDVEGVPLWDLRLNRAPDGRYITGLTGTRFAPGFEALQAGSYGSVTFTTEDFLWRDHLPLTGSRVALDAALDACWTARAEAARDPAKAAREDVRAYCQDRLNRPATINDGFLREEDLDGDGRDDVIVNYGAANCGAIGGAWCGWAGCDLALHLSRPGGYVQGFRGIAEGFRIVSGGVILRRHVSECGTLTDGPCALRYRATAEGFVKAGVVDWPG